MLSKRWLVLLCLHLAVLAASAQPLKVGVAGAPPYVTPGDQLDGLSIRVWQNLAQQAQWQYQLVAYEDLKSLQAALRDKRIDVAVGPIPVDADTAASLDLSQPYYSSRLALGTAGLGHNISEMVGQLVTFQALKLGAVLMFAMFLVAWLVWLSERKRNSGQFPPDREGYFNSVWFALVTMTTVGYGDQHPITRGGRLVTAVWMLTASTLFSALVAVVATKLTLAQTQLGEISNLNNLDGQRVGVVAGSECYSLARHAGAHTFTYQDVEGALTALSSNQIDAVLGDQLEMRHSLARRARPSVRLVEVASQSEYFAFAMPLGSELRRQIDLLIIDQRESGTLRQVEDAWLNSLSSRAQAADTSIP